MMNYEIFKEVVKEKFMDYMPEKLYAREVQRNGACGRASGKGECDS